jgi:hypothetical protein
MKIQKFITTGVVAASALMLTSSVQAIPNITIDNFNSGANLSVWYYGASPNQEAYASGVEDPFNGDGGSVYIQCDYGTGSPGNPGNSYSPLTTMDCYNGGNPWNNQGTIDFSQYQSIQFDVKWDTTSTLTIDQWNTGTNWPASFVPGWADVNFMQEQGYLQGIDMEIVGPGGLIVDLPGTTNEYLPLNANTGWRTMTIPIPTTLAGQITAMNGILLHKWVDAAWGVQAVATGHFWLDNIVLVGGSVPPPPTVSMGPTPVPGLNCFNLTENNSVYDRNEVMVTSTSGLSWVGPTNTQPGWTPTYPVTYSYDLVGFPGAPAAPTLGTYVYIFLVPGYSFRAEAVDWNATNLLAFDIQATTNGSTVYMNYKTNEPGQNPPAQNSVTFNGTTNTSITSTKLLGNYSLVFTDANDGYVQAADGTTGTFTLPAGVSAFFTEDTTTAEPFLVYFGTQANNQAAMNQSAAYSSITVSGVPGAFSENFVGEANPQNVTNYPSHYPPGVFIVPTAAKYWIDWTTPNAGFVLENAPTLNGPWQATSTYFPPLSGYGVSMQKVASGDLVSPTKDQYFRVVKHIYTNILVALPGQTFVNGTGVTGTPTTLYASTNCAIFGPETATAYAVDVNNVLCTAINVDQVLLDCTTDSAGTADFVCTPTSSSYEITSMVNGVADFNQSGAYSFFWGYAGLCAPVQESVMVTDQQVNFTNTSSLVSLDVTP